MREAELHTDGNAIAGMLGEIFAPDITTAPRHCQTCGSRHEIGAHRLYRGAGFVLRCPSCSDIAACITPMPGRYAISLRGTWTIREA